MDCFAGGGGVTQAQRRNQCPACTALARLWRVAGDPIAPGGASSLQGHGEVTHTEAKTGRVCGLLSRSRSGTMIQIKMGARQPPKEFAQ